MAPKIFLSRAFFPFWPEIFDDACVSRSTRMFSRLKARDFGTPLACSSALLMTSGEAWTPNFLCPTYPKCASKTIGQLEQISYM